jgi:serine/threonine protein kinase
MEYADGGTLREYLSKNSRKLTWNDKIRMAHQLASAISCLHNLGVIHRDLVIHLYFITYIMYL